MGKSKNKIKAQPRNSNHHDNPNRVTKRNISRRQHSQTGPSSLKAKFVRQQKNNVTQTRYSQGKQKQNHGQQSARKLKIPFNKWDQVLLVGEGDFSFALSLASNYPIASITATSYDSEESLKQKYPNVVDTLDKLQFLSYSQKRRFVRLTNGARGAESSASEIATTDETIKLDRVQQDSVDSWEGFSTDESPSNHASNSGNELKNKTLTPSTSEHPRSSFLLNVYHSINAVALSTTHRKLLRPHSPFTKIVFNFPHTGGLSTDVNRQVRANQELLVGFFNAAKTFLATKRSPAKAITLSNHNSTDIQGDHGSASSGYESDGEEDTLSNEKLDEQRALSSGQILVTLFEGEPYTLWNIRDLARHCGLQVIESFKFPWTAYPGYKHARTIGDIVTGKDRSEEGKRKGSWRGEERDARCYVIGLKEELGQSQKSERKRWKKDDDSSDSDDE